MEYKSRKTEEDNDLNYQIKVVEQKLKALQKDEEFLNSNRLSIVLKWMLKFFLFMFGSMTAACAFLFWLFNSPTVILGWIFVVLSIFISITINCVVIYDKSKKIKRIHTLEEIKEEQERLIQDLQQIREHKRKVQEELIEINESIGKIISTINQEENVILRFEGEQELSFQNNENVLKLIRAFNKEF